MPADTGSADRHKRIMEVLQDLDLTERKDLPIQKLSGGQLKRVSIGVELLTSRACSFSTSRPRAWIPAPSSR